MADNNGSILNFTNDAEFINQCAAARQNAGNNSEALRLYRAACAKEPTNLKYRVDMMQLLNHMHADRAAYNAAVDIINAGLLDDNAAKSDGFCSIIYVNLAACLSSVGYFASALKYTKCARKYAVDDESIISIDDLYFHMLTNKVQSRQKHIKRRFIRRLHMYAENQNASRAYALARMYLHRNPKSQLAHAAMAWAEMLRGNRQDAMEQLIRALAMTKCDPWVLSIAARILICDENEQSESALETAFTVSSSAECDNVLLRQAISLGMDQLVLSITGQLLEYFQGDPYYSACHAAAMINTGDSTRAALALLKNSLDIYPDDVTTRHYIKLITQSDVKRVPIRYPEQEMLDAWAHAVFDIRAQLMSHGADVSYSDDATALLEWGLYNHDADISTSSAALLTHSKSERAKQALWHYLASYESSDDNRIAVLELMSASDIELPRLIFLKERLRSLNDNLLCRIMAYEENQLDIRTAARRLHEYPKAVISLRTLSFFAGKSGCDAHTSAVALECAYRIAQGEALNLRSIAIKRRIKCADLTRSVYSLLEYSHSRED